MPKDYDTDSLRDHAPHQLIYYQCFTECPVLEALFYQNYKGANAAEFLSNPIQRGIEVGHTALLSANAANAMHIPKMEVNASMRSGPICNAVFLHGCPTVRS